VVIFTFQISDSVPECPLVLNWFIIAPTSAKYSLDTPDNRLLTFNLYIQPTHISVMPEYMKEGNIRSAAQRSTEHNLKKNKHKGIMSDKAIGRIRNSVNWLVAAAEWKRVYSKESKKSYRFKVNFITLTLPAKSKHITDHYFKSVMLHKFINVCRYKYGLRNYIWKVEAQANGNIHAHFTTDTFIHYMALRRTWNKVCASEGLIDKFELKNGHRDPNSTDVHAVNSKTRIAAYMAKEFCKKDKDRRKISGKLWSSSYSISASNKCSVSVWADESMGWVDVLTTSKFEMIPIESSVNSMGVRDKWGEIYLMGVDEWDLLKGTELRGYYMDHLSYIRSNMQLFPPEYYEQLDYEVCVEREVSVEPIKFEVYEQADLFQ